MEYNGEFIDFIESILLNLSFIFVLFFLYHKFIENKYRYLSNRTLVTLLSGISIILCMTFSAELVDGFIFDMRLVPFIIGTLYGGRKAGVVLLGLLLSYRFVLGGEGFVVTTFEYVLIYAILWGLIPKFHQVMKIKRKVQIAVVGSMADAISLVFIYFMSSYHGHFELLPMVSLTIIYIIQIIGTFLFVIYIEKAREESRIISELKKIEKLRIVSDIAASISHEVRNPLTVTRGFLQLLKQRDINQEKKFQYIDLSLDELKRAEEIISDYLTFAKPSLENVEMLHIKEELAYVINVVRPYATMNDVEIEIETTPGVYVLGERQKLHQCLINVLKNSIEAMPKGGLLSINHEENAEQTHITICDTGVGMDKEQLERLGTPYYSTKEKGTGLGTMVVFSIVKAMRGSIQVESVKHQGSTFTISFPKVC